MTTNLHASATLRELSSSLPTFFDNLDSFAEAPEGVAKLRELILELAVTGRLDTHDGDDEPASVLLGVLRSERRKRVKAKEIRNGKPVAPITSEETPHDLPPGWEWVRLCELGEFCGGATPSKRRSEFWDGDVPWVSPKDMKSPHIASSEMAITEAALEGTRIRLIPPASILIVARSGILKRTLPVSVNDVECTVNQDLKVIIPFDTEISEYLRLMLRGHERFILEHLVKGGMTVQSLKYEEFELQPFPLPPLSEQRRIVSKVDGLMSLCDELESRGSERVRLREHASRSCLDRLVSSRSRRDLSTAWQRLSDHFEVLYDTPETLAHLRQSILQLAVQGKLVPQDPNDEPASELLERMVYKRKQIIKRYGLRSTDEFRRVSEDELPYELPDGWQWCRFGLFGAFMGGGTPSKGNPNYWSGDIPWVTPKDMKRPSIDDAIDHVSQEGIDNSSAKLIPPQSLLVVVRGMILIHSFPVAITQCELTINQDMKALVLGETALAEYLLLLGQASRDRMLKVVQRSTHGTCRLATEDVEGIVMGLPPLAEQKRIVAKVDQLLSQCDELSARLRDRQSTTQQLLTATIHQLLDTVNGPADS